MRKKKKTRSSRHAAGAVRVSINYEPSLRITDPQIRAIAKSLCTKEDNTHVAAVLKTIRQYQGQNISVAALPRGEHRNRDIKALKAFARAMDGLSLNVRAQLARHGVDLGCIEPSHVAAVARIAGDELKLAKPASKRGKRRALFRDEMFNRLGESYTIATGNPATISKTSESGRKKGGLPCGPFFRFLRAAVAPITELAKLSDTGLASAFDRRKSMMQ